MPPTMRDMGTKREQRHPELATRVRVAKGDRTRTELARAVGVNVKTVWQWEHGYSFPAGPRAVALADALGVSVRWLLTGSDTGEAA